MQSCWLAHAIIYYIKLVKKVISRSLPPPGTPRCSCWCPGLQTGLQDCPAATQTGNQVGPPSQSSPARCQRPIRHCSAHQWLMDGKQQNHCSAVCVAAWCIDINFNVTVLHGFTEIWLCCYVAKQSLTSLFSMTQVRRHSHHPLLSCTHASQALIQSIDHLVRPQHNILNVVIVVSEGRILSELLIIRKGGR